MMGWISFSGLVKCTPRITFVTFDPNHYNLYVKETQHNNVGTVICRLFTFSGNELTVNINVYCKAICLAWV